VDAFVTISLTLSAVKVNFILYGCHLGSLLRNLTLHHGTIMTTSTNPEEYYELCTTCGETPTALGYFQFSKASSAQLGSISDSWRRFIAKVEPAARRIELQQDWNEHRMERKDYWNSLKSEEQAKAEQVKK